MFNRRKVRGVMKTERGLSLIEMMVTVAILSILTTIGAPSISNIISKNHIAADINNLSSAARVARFTAIDEAVTVTLCPTEDYTSCTNNWRHAKMVFIDGDVNGARDNNEQLVLSSDPVSSNNTISGIEQALIFRPDGSVNNGGAITICPSSGEKKLASALIVSLYGRVKVATDSNNDDIKEDATGTSLSCS